MKPNPVNVEVGTILAVAFAFSLFYNSFFARRQTDAEFGLILVLWALSVAL